MVCSLPFSSRRSLDDCFHFMNSTMKLNAKEWMVETTLIGTIPLLSLNCFVLVLRGRTLGVSGMESQICRAYHRCPKSSSPTCTQAQSAYHSCESSSLHISPNVKITSNIAKPSPSSATTGEETTTPCRIFTILKQRIHSCRKQVTAYPCPHLVKSNFLKSLRVL